MQVIDVRLSLITLQLF